MSLLEMGFTYRHTPHYIYVPIEAARIQVCTLVIFPAHWVINSCRRRNILYKACWVCAFDTNEYVEKTKSSQKCYNGDHKGSRFTHADTLYTCFAELITLFYPLQRWCMFIRIWCSNTDDLNAISLPYHSEKARKGSSELLCMKDVAAPFLNLGWVGLQPDVRSFSWHSVLKGNIWLDQKLQMKDNAACNCIFIVYSLKLAGVAC